VPGVHTGSSSRGAALLILGLCVAPSDAGAIPPPELAAAVVSDLLILLAAAGSAAIAWFFSVRRGDPDGPARRAWRQLGGVVALSLVVTGALVARHRAIDRERLQAPLFRAVATAVEGADPGLPPTAVSHRGLHELLSRPDPPVLVDLRFEREEPVPDDAPHLDPLVRAEVLHVSPAQLRADPGLLRGHDQPPVLVCWTGETSSELARTLRGQGIETRFLAGGLTTLPTETGSRQRFAYPNHDRLVPPDEAARLLANGARAVAAGEREHPGHGLPQAVALSALGTAPEELRRRIAALPRDVDWLGLCWDRRSCYDAQILGDWMTDTGLTWLGRTTAPEELDDGRRASLAWAALPVTGALLFLLAGLVRRRGALPGSADVGAKAATLDRLRVAGLRVPDGYAVTAGEPLPSPADLAQLGARFAVRSSALDEDAEESAAGRYLTELQVAPAEVPAAVARVRASIGPGGAVLIQPMVEAAVAGVLFTRAPGAPAFLAVESGSATDAVTAGRAAERARLSRLDGHLLDGVLPPGLDGAELLAVARRVEALLGGPQDVEWALAPEGLTVLQSRPITAGLTDAPAFEAERRRVLDSVPEGVDPVAIRWRQHRVGEALPRPTPLALDLLRDIWSREGAMGHAHEALGLRVPAALDPVDDAPRLQSVLGTLVLVAPEGGGDAGPTDVLGRLERVLPDAVDRLVATARRRDAAALVDHPPTEHAHAVLRWWHELATEDHVALAMIAIAAEGQAGPAPALEGLARRSLVDLTLGPTTDEPAPDLSARVDPEAPLAGLLARREEVRAWVQRATDPLRAALASLDARLGLGGRIGWLRRDELLLAVDDPEAMRALAAQRATHSAGLGRPFLPVGLSPRDVESWGGAAPAASGGRWLTPPATLQGPARVLASPDELDALLPGEILVARFAEIGWAEGLDRAAAVVVQVGGALSHLAIVCRERGVPALSGVPLGGARTGDVLHLGPEGITTSPPGERS